MARCQPECSLEQGQYSKHFIFFVNYECANELVCYIILGWKVLPMTNILAY